MQRSIFCREKYSVEDELVMRGKGKKILEIKTFVRSIVNLKSLVSISNVGILKELSLWNKLKSSDPYIFASLWCKPLIFQT